MLVEGTGSLSPTPPTNGQGEIRSNSQKLPQSDLQKRTAQIFNDSAERERKEREIFIRTEMEKYGLSEEIAAAKYDALS